MSGPSSLTQIRDRVVEFVQADLLGPVNGETETLAEWPATRYLIGILYPRETPINPEEDQDHSAGPEGVDAGSLEDPIVLANASNPSAMGMTFRIPAASSTMRVEVSAGTYCEVEEDGRRAWRRKPLSWVQHVNAEHSTAYEIDAGMELRLTVRARGEARVVTATLINKNSRSGDDIGRYYFQPRIRVSGPTFLPGGAENTSVSDPELESYQLLFNHVRDYAVGHGCSVRWPSDMAEGPDFIETTFLPAHEVAQMVPGSLSPRASQGLDLAFLASEEATAICAALNEMAREYRAWIDKQEEARQSLPDSPTNLKEVAKAHLDRCRESLRRISEGIALLQEDSEAFEAFRLMNRVMYEQWARSRWLRMPESERPPEPSSLDKFTWHPFQLAFILQCLPSVTDSSSPERNTVDLLWFPTGGGKTEAYLGLAAYVIFLRRLRKKGRPESAGVTVLMRYTLRLLTIQQFQRALAIIMACEYVRREQPSSLGQVPISIGLWVGGDATPNRVTDARSALRDLRQTGASSRGNPCQVSSCPWCGETIDPSDYRIEGRPERMVVKCPNSECDFHNGLPAWLVDEDVYRFCPSLVIATVDKFARVPWLEDAAALFNRGNRYDAEAGFILPGRQAPPSSQPCEVPPPELIIQDELHLIGGPLGSLAGLYEAMVERLCSREGTRPKVIASTATIRRAGQQCRDLFERAVHQFPPPALDIRDSFFAREASLTERPGRLYVGIHAPGRSGKTALVRLYAALLTAVHVLDVPDEAKDPYWTLLGYFNSLRELGGAVRLVEDDIPDRIKQIADKGQRRRLGAPVELTSRRTAAEIRDLLDRMAVRYPSQRALDTLLATNMISVGVDIQRFGLMVVTGQPKTTAEYIQATSRVGRQHPGLVYTLYNWTRPRDRSHYERFQTYHASLYRYVEASSVTPFSDRARDKALHAVFAALVRHSIDGMHSEDAASRFHATMPGVDEIVEFLKGRAGEVDRAEQPEVERELRELVSWWEVLARSESGLTYSDTSKAHLLHAAGDENIPDLSRPTLHSLRDVEPQSALWILR